MVGLKQTIIVYRPLQHQFVAKIESTDEKDSSYALQKPLCVFNLIIIWQRFLISEQWWIRLAKTAKWSYDAGNAAEGSDAAEEKRLLQFDMGYKSVVLLVSGTHWSEWVETNLGPEDSNLWVKSDGNRMKCWWIKPRRGYVYIEKELPDDICP